MVWAVQKARVYLAGSNFELVVDHRPLIPIINSKTLDELPSPRIIRLKEKLAMYRMTAVWRAGIKHKVVDCLSRYPVDLPSDDDLRGESDIENCQLVLQQIATVDSETGEPILEDHHLVALRTEGQLDPEYRKLKEAVYKGFPKEKAHLDLDLHPFWPIQADATLCNDIVMVGSRLVIPKSMRPNILKLLHASHQGQTRTLRRARQVVYWPNMTNDIQNVVRSCEHCATLLPSQPVESLMSPTPPKQPLEHVAADLFHLSGWEYLILVDRYSGWPLVVRCGRSAASSDIIAKLKAWIMDLEAPSKVSTDGGPQFRSQEFKSFCKEWGIQHIQSSPYNHQSNGAAEAAVKTIKHLVQKTTKNGDLNNDAFREGLLELRNTPGETGRSPAQLLFGRSLRSKLPVHPSSFQPSPESVFASPEPLSERGGSRYELRGRDLPVLEEGRMVRLQNQRTLRWDAIGKIVSRHERGRSYVVGLEDGGTCWRNRRFLRPYYGSTTF